MLSQLLPALGISLGVGGALLVIFYKITGRYEQAGYDRAVLDMAGLNMEAIRKANAAALGVSHDPADIVRDPDNRDRE